MNSTFLKIPFLNLGVYYAEATIFFKKKTVGKNSLAGNMGDFSRSQMFLPFPLLLHTYLKGSKIFVAKSSRRSFSTSKWELQDVGAKYYKPLINGAVTVH